MIKIKFLILILKSYKKKLIKLSKYNINKKYYLITINIDEKKNYIFEKFKLLKIVSAGSTKNIRFYSS